VRFLRPGIQVFNSLSGACQSESLKVLDERGDMQRVHRCELIDAFAGAPAGEAPGGVHIGPVDMIIVNLAL